MRQSLNMEGADENSIMAMGGRVKSLPREDMSGGYAGTESSLIGRVDNLRRSTKNSEVREVTGKLLGYGKRGNRPSANALPQPKEFTVSEVKVNVMGRPETRNGDISSDRFATEYVNVGSAKPRAIPNFTRILSARTA